HPDVAVDDCVAVVLQVDPHRLRALLGNRIVLVNLDTVVPDGGAQITLVIGLDLDVVGLPDQRRKAHVDLRLAVAVKRAALVVLALQAETVEHLNLLAEKIDAAVAASLATLLRLIRRAELQMQLAGCESLLAGGAAEEQIAINNLSTGPFGWALAIEED